MKEYTSMSDARLFFSPEQQQGKSSPFCTPVPFFGMIIDKLFWHNATSKF
jgi:hypothetical protein